jgi:hypothetical protein
VEIADHLPVSKLKDVKVVIDPRSTGSHQLRDMTAS